LGAAFLDLLFYHLIELAANPRRVETLFQHLPCFDVIERLFHDVRWIEARTTTQTLSPMGSSSNLLGHLHVNLRANAASNADMTLSLSNVMGKSSET
jgi:hypothetical protein